MKGGTTIYHSTILIAVAIVLQIFAMAPGMTAQNTERASIESGTVVRTTSISTNLPNQLKLQHKSQARQIASEFSEPHTRRERDGG
jgi:hypothetical protein